MLAIERLYPVKDMGEFQHLDAKCQIGAMILPSNDAEVTDGKGRD